MRESVVKYELFSYIIDCKDYNEFKDQLNKENKTIITIKPTFVAGKMSDRFAIYAMNLNDRKKVENISSSQSLNKKCPVCGSEIIKAHLNQPVIMGSGNSKSHYTCDDCGVMFSGK